MCCPSGNGCGRGCGNCGGSNPEDGAVGGFQPIQQTAQELQAITALVKGFFHTGGHWDELVESIRRWKCESLGCCALCLTAVANCFRDCANNGALSREDLNDILTRLSLEFGITTICVALERLSGQLGEICHKPKEEAENMLRQACEKVAVDLREAEGVLVQTEVDESSLLDPEMRRLDAILEMISKVCAAVADATVLESVISADSASGSDSR